MNREQLLDEVATAYLKAVEAGQNPDQAEWLARYPDLADDLKEFFAAQQSMDRAAAPLRALAPLASESPTVGATTPVDGVPAVGDSLRYFGDYELLEEIGRGGMGVVYKARHLKLDRVVALKMILAGGHAGEADLARFKTEAEAVARLQHPNIVQIFEVGEHGGLPFFSLEFCAGGGLDRKLGGTPLPRKDAAALVEKLARAMQAAHEKGVIHRDLKPANVLLAEDGTPKVTDFGLAKKLNAEAGQTRTGAVIGTPSYMAPEQAAGKSKEIGLAVDVYALGAILYECLTGRPPFKAATALDTVLQVIEAEPVPLRQLIPKLDRNLETICLKCLRKEAGRRYKSAAALADDLERWQRGEPIAARPVGRIERAWMWVRRHPVVAALCAAAVACLVVGVTLGLMLPHVTPIDTGPPTAPVGIHLEELRSVEDLFDLAGQEARAFKYSGGDVEFWVEIEVSGRKETVGPVLATSWLHRGDRDPPPPESMVEGYLLWVRNEADDSGRERWKVAYRKNLVAEKTSGYQASSPLALATFAQTQANSYVCEMLSDRPVQVWNSDGRAVVREETSSIPTLLPTDRDVCIKEIREERKPTKDQIAAEGAGMLGMLGSSHVGPLVGATALTAGDAKDVHTIKLMCRAASNQQGEGKRLEK